MTGVDMRRLASITFRGAGAIAQRLVGRTSRRLRRAHGLIPVLMYHRVQPDDASADEIEPGMFVGVSTFEKHIGWLAKRFDLVTLSEALDVAHPSNGRRLAVITFDDGWRDNLTHAWPILRRYNARATIFLVTDWVGQIHTPQKEFLSPEEVRVLANQGIEMGAHTMSHPRLDEASHERIEFEMQTSKAAVAAWTGRPCRTFAYPYGRFSDHAVEAAARHFDGAVAVGGGWWAGGQPLSRIPRIAIHEDMTRWIPMFESRLAGAA